MFYEFRNIGVPKLKQYIGYSKSSEKCITC